MKLEERKLYNQVLRSYIKNFDKYFGIKRTPQEIKIVSSTEKKGIKRKMSAIKKVVIGLNILSLLFLFACGEDNITNNNGNPPDPNVLLSLDTLKVEHNSLIFLDSTLTSNVLSKSIRIEFRTETNCVITDNPRVTFTYKYPVEFAFDSLNKSINRTEIRDSTLATSLNLNLFMNAHSQRYLRIIDLKVYYVN